MRLLNTDTLEFKEFFDDDIPSYAILSHRWGEDEVSYQDMLGGKKKDGASYAKIRKFCATALYDKWEWGWVDTCCIDKKSSAELSEAINAMYTWYQQSEMCYAYLFDVDKIDSSYGWPTFAASTWFTRGWTLQELLAPLNLVFLDSAWNLIGTRSDMVDQIEVATDIPRYVFLRDAFFEPEDYSIAEKMSWAASRETSRIEDLAYCLIGLFDINMPLLYGEGSRAFTRLQEEIIKTSSDESIFIWSEVRGLPYYFRGCLLAPDPSCFSKCSRVEAWSYFWRKPISMTNNGLKIKASIFHKPSMFGNKTYLIPLNCRLLESEFSAKQLAIRVKVSPNWREASPESSYWERVAWCEMPEEVEVFAIDKTIYLGRT